MNGLLVDDDAVYARVLQRSLERRGLQLRIALDAASALLLVEEEAPDFALVDLKIGSESGLNLIAPLRAARPDMQIILVTGYASVATAVDAIKRGADNYLPKPVTAEALIRDVSTTIGPEKRMFSSESDRIWRSPCAFSTPTISPLRRKKPEIVTAWSRRPPPLRDRSSNRPSAFSSFTFRSRFATSTVAWRSLGFAPP